MLPYADKPLRDYSQNSRNFGNMTVRKTPGSALWPATNKCVVAETERLLGEKFINKNTSHDMGANRFHLFTLDYCVTEDEDQRIWLKEYSTKPGIM
jgi:hypothetical protein